MALDFEPINDLTGPGEARWNLDLLARMFPSAFEDGALDVDALRGLIGETAGPRRAEAYGLRWPGLAEAGNLATVPATQTLLPRPEESVDWDTTQNIVIEGDNLEVLRLLRRGYTGKVDVIYIDPPYNTGNDFIYNDKRTTSQAEHEMAAGQRDENGPLQNGHGSDRAQDRKVQAAGHTAWLSMMYPRLLVAQHLLKETGVIIAAIDDNEHARLKLLLDHVFGPENYAANVVWQGSGRGDARFTSAGIDYMLIYAKSKPTLIQRDMRWTETKQGVAEVTKAAAKAWEESGHNPEAATEILQNWWKDAPDDIAKGLGGSRGYREIDENGRVFARGDLSSPNPRENLMYDLPHPVTGIPVRMYPSGWRYSRETMDQKIAEGRILFGEDEMVSPRYKRFLDEEQPIRPVFERDRASAGFHLRRLLDSDVFEYPKDHTVLAKWINSVSKSNPDALVLDFFAGSGSTGHAVMDLNATDGGHRRYILVQLDEKVGKDGFATIGDIARERLRRAGAQIAAQPTLDAPDLDTGFRSYRLASSNVRPWDGTGKLDLMGAVDNLVEGRSTDDLLVEMMLRLGVDLTTPVRQRKVAGSPLYNLAGTLFAYFGMDITTERANEIAAELVKWRDEEPGEADTTVVVRDTGFVNSSAKLNFAAALKQARFTTLQSI